MESTRFKRQPSTKPFVDEHSMTGKDLETSLTTIGIKQDRSTKNHLYSHEKDKLSAQYTSNNSTTIKSNRS